MKVFKKTMQSGLSSANIVVLNKFVGEQAVRRPVGVRANASTENPARIFGRNIAIGANQRCAMDRIYFNIKAKKSKYYLT